MASIPPRYLDSVVAIGCEKIDSNMGKTETIWVATGFLFGYRNNDYEPGKYQVYLVTNKHVFKDLEKVKLLFNPQGGKPAKEFDLDLTNKGQKLYKEHANPLVDIAVVPINVDILKRNSIEYFIFTCDKTAYAKEALRNEIQSTEGDGVFALGYPMGIVGKNRQYVILRGGCIARIHDMLEGNSTDYIIDAFTFPGNSGGPVICKPEIAHIEGTKVAQESRLIGVVKGYMPYKAVAISLQTKKPRVIFEENSGLTAVEPVDYIIETIEQN